MLIDFIMKKTTDEEPSEIRLGLKTKLEEITFADDIALLSSRFKLAKKTKVIKLNSNLPDAIKTEEQYLQDEDTIRFTL